MRTGLSDSVKVFYPRFSREDLLVMLREGIAGLQAKMPLQQVILFGSYAQSRHTVASDIDLLVVYQGEPRADAFALVKRTLRIPGLEPHVYSEEEYEQLKQTVERMVRGGVVIWGTNSGAVTRDRAAFQHSG
jgi:predicted nucleotidyltransferase